MRKTNSGFIFDLAKLRVLTAIISSILVVTLGFSTFNAYAGEGVTNRLVTGRFSLAALPTSATGIYLNGDTGDDTKDASTAENAVKTFEKAKEIAAANPGVKTIWVTGTVFVSGDVSLSGTNAILKRDPSFRGDVLRIDNDATLHDITIDGNKAAMQGSNSNVGNIVYIRGANVDIKDGTVLQNNIVKDNNIAVGGAVYIDLSTVNMTGGTIKNNQATWGGGVYLSGSANFNMSGGVIENNSALSSPGTFASGGGIATWSGRTTFNNLNISGDAVIRNNYSEEVGGGISVGTYTKSNAPENMTMTGGTISGNKSGASGGGIFIQAGIGDAHGTATISGGSIINNEMLGSGLGSSAFGGGGIYVNGFAESTGFNNGVLKIKNALITENTAQLEGGGYASCPSSDTHIYVKSGVALYNNNAASANEVYILASTAFGTHSGDPTYEISPFMMGGTAYLWKDENGNPVPLNKLSGRLMAINNDYVSLTTDVKDDANAKALARVKISGNMSATRGAGIGSNGTVIMGDSDLTSVDVTKIWQVSSSTAIPTSIEIELYRATEDNRDNPLYIGYETMRPNLAGEWKLTFSNLPKYDESGKLYIYTVKERLTGDFIVQITGGQDSGYVITNKDKPKLPPPPNTPPKPKTPPKTGDSSTTFMYMMIIFLSGSVIATTGAIKRKG